MRIAYLGNDNETPPQPRPLGFLTTGSLEFAMGVAKVLVEKARELSPDMFRLFVKESREAKKFAFGTPYEQSSLPRFHIREAAEAAFGRDNWQSGLKSFSRQKGWVQEAATGATDASAFKDTIASMTIATITDGYQHTVSDLLDLAGVAETPDQPEGTHDFIQKYSATGIVQAVAEGTEYPRTGFATLRTTAPEPTKYGEIAVLTLETVKSNDTRGFLKDNLDVGRAVGQHQLEAFIRVLTGIVNNYTRNGSTLNTYLTSGAWINKLTDFDINNGPAEFDRITQLVDRMVHPVTGKSIKVDPNAIIAVGNAVFRTKSTVAATQIRQESADGKIVTIGSNPLDGYAPVKHNANIRRMLIAEGGYTAALADTMVFYGNFKEAVQLRQVEPFTVEEIGDLGKEWIGFSQDLVYAVKGRWWGSYFINDPLQIYQAYKAS